MAPRITTSVRDVDTPLGPARLHAWTVARPRALLVLGHGAGRGVDTPDLLGLAAALPLHGVSIVLVDQPWVLAGRGIAPAPAVLDVGWRAALDAVRALKRRPSGVPLLVGGRSAGARVACRTCLDVDADALLLLAFPLAPPSARKSPAALERAVASRAAEIAVPRAARLPVVVVQGERDVFGGPRELRSAWGRGARVVPVPGADHSLRVARGGPDPGPVLLGAALSAVGAARGE
jgi:predicted alpha/beta-hydrolase family hydrolase